MLSEGNRELCNAGKFPVVHVLYTISGRIPGLESVHLLVVNHLNRHALAFHHRRQKLQMKAKTSPLSASRAAARNNSLEFPRYASKMR